MKHLLKDGLLLTISLSVLLIGATLNVTANSKNKSITTGSAINTITNNGAAMKVKSPELRFIVMSDSRGSDNGINAKVLNKIMASIKKLAPQPKFIVIPGDLVSGATSYEKVKSQLQNFKSLVTKYYPETFFYPGGGNHEVSYGVNGDKALNEVFPDYKAVFLKDYNRTAYYFDNAGSRFFMLNTDHPGNYSQISDTQLKWINENLSTGSKHNFFFIHEPAYPTGTHVGSSLDAYPMQRDKLWQLIDKSNSPIVFCGHEHFYTRRHINSDFNESIKGTDFKFTKNIYQVTVGSCGAPLYKSYKSTKDVDVPPISQYHYSLVDLKDNIVNTTVFNIEGKIIDFFKVVN
jgi:hypothetical protein